MRLLFLHLTLYSGLFCETPPPMVLLQTSPCDNYECQNGAQCIVAHQEPVCRCLAGFAGQKCEKLITVNFVGKDSYVELPSAKIRPQANISLQVCHADYLLLVLFWEITLSTSTRHDSWRLLSSPLTLKISHLNAAGLANNLSWPSSYSQKVCDLGEIRCNWRWFSKIPVYWEIHWFVYHQKYSYSPSVGFKYIAAFTWKLLLIWDKGAFQHVCVWTHSLSPRHFCASWSLLSLFLIYVLY